MTSTPNALLFEEVWKSTDVAVLSTEEFYEEFLLLRDPSAPTRFTWRTVSPAGLYVEQDGDRGCRWVDGRGTVALRIPRPEAVDATGTSRAAAIKCTASEISLELDVTSMKYPILLDPVIDTGIWVRAPEALPTLFWHGSAFDSARDRTVVFGGMLGSEYRGDTFEWDGASWMKVPVATSPPARGGGALAFDSARGVTVLFGGYRENDALGDTWEYDGVNWTRRYPVHSPSPRFGHAIAFDPLSSKTILFGGALGNETLDDTWQWDGNDWQQLQPAVSPVRRTGHVMAFDEASGRMLVVGGTPQINAGNQLILFSETWSWDGTTWAMLSDTWPNTRSPLYAAATIDPLSKQVLVSGGLVHVFGDLMPDLMTWNGQAWAAMPTSSAPPVRYQHSMVLDSGRARVVLFGGRDTNTLGGTCKTLGDTWEWSGSEWISAASRAHPDPNPARCITFDQERNETILFSGTDGGETWAWKGSQWARKPSGTHPSSCGAVAFDSRRRLIVLFNGETWEWNGMIWTKRSLPANPVVWESAMADDSARGKIVLFGVPTCAGCQSETWEYDGTAWAKKSVVHAPPNLTSPSMAYDAATQRTLLVGTFYNPGGYPRYRRGTWEWDGVDWSSRGAESEFQLDYDGYLDGSLAFHTVRNRMLQHIGIHGWESGETWEWDANTWRKQLASNPMLPRIIGHGMTFDSSRGRIVVFGGTGFSFSGLIRFSSSWDPTRTGLADTWEYHSFGGACTLGSQCDTAHCVDGVCCEDSSCSAPCRSCDTPDNPGRCDAVRNAVDPDTCSGAHRCDSTGACKLIDGQPCSAGDECVSRNCVDNVCCATPSCGTCQACNTTAQPGTCALVTKVPDPDSCSGSNRCDSTGTCKVAEGQPCSDGNQCASGHCADGVCCDSPCSGPCASCTAAGKGHGSDGFCDQVSAGKSSGDDCTDQGDLSCGTDGTCDGFGGCRLYPVMTACGPGSCSDQPDGMPSRRTGDVCSGFGACVSVGQKDCGMYRCQADQCGTSWHHRCPMPPARILQLRHLPAPRRLGRSLRLHAGMYERVLRGRRLLQRAV